MTLGRLHYAGTPTPTCLTVCLVWTSGDAIRKCTGTFGARWACTYTSSTRSAKAVIAGWQVQVGTTISKP